MVELDVELPRLRPGAAPERLEVEGAGACRCCRAGLPAPRAPRRRAVRLRVESEPGRVALTLCPVYLDRRSVEVEDALTVVPAGESSGFPWLGAAVGTFLAVALAAGALLVARRRAWIASRFVLFEQFLDDDLGCASAPSATRRQESRRSSICPMRSSRCS